MLKPHLKTRLPGPKARAWIAKDLRFVSPSYTRVYPAVIAHGKGVWLTDVDGNQLLDFNAGIAVCSTGHAHPKVVAAIKAQAEKLLHYSGTDFYYTPEIELAERLAKLVHTGKDNRVFLCNSGAEAVEGALKLARYKSKRPQFLAFLHSFHGRTMGALSFTSSKAKQRKGFFPLVPGVTHVPYAYCYRCVFNLKHPSCNLACLKYIEEEILGTIVPPEEVAGILFEPVLGEGGYVFPPDDWIRGLRNLATKYGMFLIADEIQSGMGRTGKMLALEHSGVKPDIVTLAKGIASGLPLGAFVAPAEIMDWEPGSHGTTFGGNPVSCAAGLATLEVLNAGLVANSAKVGAFMLKELNERLLDHPMVGDIRGRGLMIGVEIVKDKRAKERAPKERDAIVQKCFEKGLLILGSGANTVRMMPPLVITKEEAKVGLDIFEEVLLEVLPPWK